MNEIYMAMIGLSYLYWTWRVKRETEESDLA